MKPVSFKGQTEEWRNLPGFEPLPVATQASPAGWVTSCWKVSFIERVKLFFRGRLFITQQTYNYNTNAILVSIGWQQPNCKNCGSPMELHKKSANRCPYNKDQMTKSEHYPGRVPGTSQNCQIGTMQHNYNSD